MVKPASVKASKGITFKRLLNAIGGIVALAILVGAIYVTELLDGWFNVAGWMFILAFMLFVVIVGSWKIDTKKFS